MKKTKLIALFGPAGAGKDYLLGRWATFLGAHIVKNHSTRPMREQEKEGDPYYFINDDVFEKMVDNNEFIQTTDFNNWYYGTALSELRKNKLNIGVFNIAAIQQLLADDRIEVLPILITATDKRRLLRQLNREGTPNCSEICRRFLADEQDYKNISFKYIPYRNEGDVPLSEHHHHIDAIVDQWQNSLIIQ